MLTAVDVTCVAHQGMPHVAPLVIDLNDDSSDDDASGATSEPGVTSSSLQSSIDTLIKGVRASVEQVLIRQ